jgi:hypothetical protein
MFPGIKSYRGYCPLVPRVVLDEGGVYACRAPRAAVSGQEPVFAAVATDSNASSLAASHRVVASSLPTWAVTSPKRPSPARHRAVSGRTQRGSVRQSRRASGSGTSASAAPSSPVARPRRSNAPSLSMPGQTPGSHPQPPQDPVLGAHLRDGQEPADPQHVTLLPAARQERPVVSLLLPGGGDACALREAPQRQQRDGELQAGQARPPVMVQIDLRSPPRPAPSARRPGQALRGWHWRGRGPSRPWVTSGPGRALARPGSPAAGTRP